MAALTFRPPSGNRQRRREAPARPQPFAAAGAGVVAGIAFIAIVAVMGSIVYGESIWAPFHRIAAMAMGPVALEDLDVMDSTVVLWALLIHGGLAALYGLVLAAIVVEFSPEAAPWLGAVCGMLIYLVNLYGFAALFPWMVEMRGPVTLFAHAVFGGLLASCYWALHEQRQVTRRLSAG